MDCAAARRRGQSEKENGLGCSPNPLIFWWAVVGSNH
jgi:hypothetical protein